MSIRGPNKMPMRYKKWCSHGCGKKVVYVTGVGENRIKGYECQECKTWWRTKEDLAESW